MAAPIPDEVRAQYGSGVTPGIDANGQRGLIPADLETGQKTFETNFNNARGDLATIEKNGTTLVNSFNALGDPHASLATKLAATAALVTLVSTTTVALATTAQLTAFAATVGISVPALGAFVIAAFAVLIVVVAAVGEARANAPRQDTDAEGLALAINQLPTNLPLPYNVRPPTLLTVQAMGILATILNAESQGKSANKSTLDLATNIFNGNSGAAENLYAIAADVLLNPRWKLGFGKVTAWNWTTAEQIRQAEAQNPRAGFGIASYEDVLNSFRNTALPRSLPSLRFQDIQVATANPEIALSASSAVNLAKLPVAQQVRNGSWIVPRYFPLESPSYDPYDVARYVIIFSVLYSFSDPRQARAATYAAVYLVLLQKAWAFKASKAVVPPELYATMGFMLDLVSHYPFVRTEENRVFNPLSGTSSVVRQPVFKDVDWYVQYYLAMAPQLTETLPGEVPTGPTTTTPGTSPFGTVPGTAPVGPKISGDVSAMIRPGIYLMEIDIPNYRYTNPEIIVQTLAQYGVTSHILPSVNPGEPGPGPLYRVVAEISRPLRTTGFLPRFNWKFLRKL